MLPGDRLLCAFVKPLAAGVAFRAWPLHVTVLPWFRLDDPSSALAAGLERALFAVRPFTAAANGEALFGPHKNRPVRLLQKPTPFMQIEAQARTYLHKKRAMLVDETTKRAPEFRPHVTEQNGVGLKPGDTFYCDRLYIVEQKGVLKEATTVLVLGAGR